MDWDALAARPRHVVAICGAAVSGSEAAASFARRDVLTVVFEQNARPYGKIEDGLPRWHDKLREQEYARIDACLATPGVVFVPRVQLGRELQLSELIERFGLSAVVLANGAWRDRPLPLPDIERYVGKGLVYQNAFVYAFNHDEEPGFTGLRNELSPGAIVIGGGLASIDVVKILQVELYRRALAARGVELSVVELEHQGIPKTLAAHGCSADELGIAPATLYYRRGVKDMPIAFPRDDTPEQLQKTQLVREKLVHVLEQKFLVRIAEHHVPVAPIVSGERMVGMRFRRSEVREGKLVELPGSDYDVRAPLTVSSIGSVPEPIPGIPTRGELYDYADWNTGQVRGLPGVYGLGNVLTGQGNIKDSRHSAEAVSQHMIDSYLGIVSDQPTELYDIAHAKAHDAAERIAERVAHKPLLAPERIRAFLQFARGLSRG